MNFFENESTFWNSCFLGFEWNDDIINVVMKEKNENESVFWNSCFLGVEWNDDIINVGMIYFFKWKHILKLIKLKESNSWSDNWNEIFWEGGGQIWSNQVDLGFKENTFMKSFCNTKNDSNYGMLLYTIQS